MKIQRGLAVLAVGVAVLVAACTDSSNRPTGTTTRSSSSSPTTTSKTIAIPTPVVSADAQRPTQEGAVAFFRHFIAVYNYTYATLDPAPLRTISQPACKFCSAATENAVKAKQQGISNEGGELVVTTAISAPGQPESGLIVNAVVDQKVGRSLGHDGSVITTVPVSKDVRIDARVLWTGGRWIMTGVDVNPEKPK